MDTEILTIEEVVEITASQTAEYQSDCDREKNKFDIEFYSQSLIKIINSIQSRMDEAMYRNQQNSRLDRMLL